MESRDGKVRIAENLPITCGECGKREPLDDATSAGWCLVISQGRVSGFICRDCLAAEERGSAPGIA